MARKARTKVAVPLQPVARRVERGALLRGTALTAVVGLAFVVPAAAQPAANARPQGGQVVAGSAAIGVTANTTTITQSTNRAAIDWRSFDVGRDQSVTFQQPNSASVTLNRVTGPDPSAIAGRISANGQLVLTNPSGVTFYQGSQVNAQSVIVSAAGISNRNFMSGKMVFDQAAHPNARIENQGTITVKQAGLAALVAPSVANSGTINARMGHAVLAGGAVAHTLDMYGDGLVSIDVTKHVVQAPVGPDGRVVTALVTNTGVIAADGGTVQLTARAADGVVQDLVRAGGTIRANTAGTQTGRIEIAGNGGSVVIEGRVAADGRAPGSTGGTVVAAGSTMTSVAPTARISANGYAGGGLVALGTTAVRARGTGPAPAGTSARTVLAAGSRVSANATVAGDGGRVTVLSTDTTVVAGATSARGGRVSGSGGTVELSGETGFRLTGRADTSAPHGVAGTIILDPRDLTITSTPTGTNIPPGNGNPNIAYNTPDTVTDAYVTPAQLQGLTGNIHLQATRDLTVASSFSYNGGPTGTALTLEAGRNLTVNSGVSITNGSSSGYTLTLIAGSSAIPGYDPTGALNMQGALGASFVSLSAGTGGITLGGTIGTFFHGSTGSVSFQTTGPVTQTGGFLQTGTVSGTAASVSLTAANNQITYLDGFNPFTTTVGGFALASVVPPLTVSASPAGQPAVSVPAGQTITLLADALTLTGGAGTFALSAPGGTVVLAPLTAGNSIQITGSSTIPGGTTGYNPSQLALINTGTLQLGRAASTGDISFGQAGYDTVIDLTRFPGIAVATTGTVGQTTQLQVNALSGSAGNLTLNNAFNLISTLPGFVATGGLTVTNAGDLTVSGTVSANGGLSITSGHNLVQASGTISGPNGLSLLGSNSLSLAGAVTTNRGLSLGAGPGGITLSGTVNAAQSLQINTNGPLIQTGGSVATADLSGSAASVSLPSRANAITGAGINAPLTTADPAGDVLLVTGSPLSINTGAGNPTVSGGISVQPGRTVTLVTDFLTVGVDPNGNGSINAPNGTVVVAPYTTGGSVLLTSGAKPGTGLSLTATELGQIGAPTLQLGGAPGAPYVPVAGNITVGQAGDAPIDLGSAGITRLVLQATGAVTQTTGLGVATVSGVARSLNLPDPGNFIGTLDGFTATAGDIALHTSSGLLVSGALLANNGAGNVTLSSETPIANRPDNAALVLAANVTGSTVSLNSLSGNPSVTGGIAQDAGIITANTLTGAGDFATLAQPNRVANLDAFATTGALTVTTVLPLRITGAVSSSGSAVTLNAAGLTQTAASSISAPELAGSSTATTLLDSRNNAVSAMGSFNQSAGDFTLVTSAPTLSINPVMGQVSAPAGSVTFVADGLNAGRPISGTAIAASGAVSFAPYTPSRRIELIGNTAADPNSLSVSQTLIGFIRAGRLSLGDGSTTGAINVANTGETIDLRASVPSLQLRTTGAITEGVSPGGQNGGGTLALDVNDVTGRGGSITLNAPGNAISLLGAPDGVAGGVAGLQATAGDLSVQSASFLTVPNTAAVGATGAVSITAPGGLTVAGLVTGNAVTLSAPGATLTQTGGTISAGTTVTLAATGGTVSQSGGAITATDVTLQANSGAVTQSGGTITATGTLTLQAAAGMVSQTGGTMAANTLAGTVGAASLGSLGNGIAQLGAFAATGAFTLQDGQTLTVAGPFSANTATLGVAGNLVLSGPVLVPGTLALSVSGAVTQPGGTVTAGTLTGTAASVAMTAGNAVTTLGAFTATGAFALTDAGTLTVAGPLSATGADLRAGNNLLLNGTVSTPGGTLNLSATNTITQGGGTVTAGTLTGNATAVTLTGTGNAVTTLGTFTATGGFALTDGQTLTVAGPVSAGSATLLATNLVLNGPLTATTGTLTLNAPGGAITQPGGSISAPILAGNAASATLNGAGNAVTTLGAFTTTGAFTLTDAGTLTVGGPLSAASATLTTGGNLVLNGTVGVTGTLTVGATGTLTQPGGAVTAGTLTGSAASVALNQPGNQVGSVGGFTATGAFALQDGTTLTVAGPLSAGSVTLNDAANLILAGTVSAPTGAVVLNALGTITQPAGGIAAATLGGSAASATLNGSNAVGMLGAFTTTGAFALTDTQTLTVNGPLAASSATLTTVGNLILAGTVSAPTGTLTLSAMGTVTQPGGTVLAGTLTGNAASVALNGTGNAVGTLGAFTTTGAFGLTDGQTLTVGGPVSAGSAALTLAGSLVVSGALSTTGTLAISATGNVSEPGGSVSAGVLTGNAASVSLTGPGNAVGTLGAFTATAGDFALADGTGLTVAGPLSARNASLATAGDLVLAGTLSTPTGTLTLSAPTGAITQTGGAITTAVLTGGAGGSVVLDGRANTVGTLGALAAGGDVSLTDSQGVTVAGTVSAGAGRTLRLVDDALAFGPGGSLQAPGGTVALAEYTPGQGVVLGGPGSFVGTAAPVVANTLSVGSSTGGAVVITGAFNLSNVAALDLESGGAISETGAGAIQVGTLAGQGGSVALGGANQVGTLGSFTATAGNLVFSNAGGLTVSGPVSAAANATLNVSGNLVLAGNLSTPAGTLTLNAPGNAITQTGGAITAATLTGTAGTATLNGTGNAVGTLGAFTTAGAFALADGQTLTVAGPLSASNVSLTAAGNLILAGPVSAPAGTVALNATGAVTEPGGTVTAAVLTGTAASAALTGTGNAVATLGSFTATAGDFALTDGTALTVAGPLAGFNVSLSAVGNLLLNGSVSAPTGTLALSATGAVTQAGGTVTAATLTGNAASASLNSGTNVVGTLGGFTATVGDFALTDSTALTVTGPLSANNVSLTTGGNLVLNGSVAATAGTLTLNAPAGTITQPGGSISAGTLAGNAASATLNGTANAVDTLGGFTATAGDFALTDNQALNVAGPLSARNVSLTAAGGLVLAGTVSAPGGTLTLNAPGSAVTQTGGTVTAAVLVGTAGSANLNGTGNAVDILGGFTTTAGDFAFTDNQALTVAGPLSASNVSLTTAGNLLLSGPVSTTGTLALAVVGTVTEPGGTVAAGTVTGNAGSVALNGTGNAVGNLGSFTATAGDFALADGQGLTVSGPLSARNVSLTAAGNLALAGTVSAPRGTLTLSATGAITQPGGAVTAATLAGGAASVALNQGGNAVDTLGTFTARAGDFALTDNQALTVAGPLFGTNLTLTTAGNLVLAGNVSAPGGTLTLNAPTGSITQTAGTITAAALTGNADSASLPAAANDIATLAGFTTRGDFTLMDGRSLVVTAPVRPTTVTLGVNGDLLLNSSVTATTVVLNVTGTITESAGGLVVAGTLAGDSGGAVLTGGNQVDALGTFTTRTGFALNTAGALTVSGAVTDRQSVSITANGTLALPGSVSAPAVTLLTTNGGAIAQTGILAAPGTLTLGADGGATLAGAVSAGTLLVSTPGAVVQTGGTLALGTLTGSAGRIDVGGNGAARIDTVADLSAGTTMTVVDAGALRVSGTLAAPYLTVTATGTLTLDNGAIRTDGQPLSAQTGATAAAPGSVLGVRAGAGGTGTIRQLGTTAVTSYGGGTATLRLDLPASGGTLHLNNLQAGGTDLALNLGSGTADGALVVRNLSVRGAGGSAAFTGEVQGRTDMTAAQVSAISPAVDLRYTINNCAIALLSCSAGTSPGSTFVSIFEAAAIASILRPDILALDVLDLSVTRDRDDPTLLLPNISDRDY